MSICTALLRYKPNALTLHQETTKTFPGHHETDAETVVVGTADAVVVVVAVAAACVVFVFALVVIGDGGRLQVVSTRIRLSSCSLFFSAWQFR